MLPPFFYSFVDFLLDLSNEVLRWALSFLELNNLSEDSTNTPWIKEIKPNGDNVKKKVAQSLWIPLLDTAQLGQWTAALSLE